MRIAVIDGQGGGIGKKLIEKLNEKNVKDMEIAALGTNSTATAIMLKAGAAIWSTGVHVIMGPLAIVIPNSIMGEITPRISYAVGNSTALLQNHEGKINFHGFFILGGMKK